MVCSCGAPSERKRSRSARFARTTATPVDAPSGARRTPRGLYAVSQLGAALSTPITAMSGFGPKSQNDRAVPDLGERVLVQKYRSQAERRRRGSRASRRASPRKLKANTAEKMARPGPTLIHHLRL